MEISRQFIKFLEYINLPWVRFDDEANKFIVVVDNHLMSTYRNCPQHFFYSNVLGFQRKSGIIEDERQRSWYLDFGILLHRMLELYYQEFRKPNFDVLSWASKRASEEWHNMNMNLHLEHKECKLMGGMLGFAGLLVQYATVLAPENEKLRVLGTEVSFGRNGEVILYKDAALEIFLAGRMDLIVDDGYFICPLDHKTIGSFRADSALQFETDEGPTGYVYALSKILPTIVPENQILKRDCTKILMNLIQKKPTADPKERFKRVPIRKTTEQLEQYRLRMINTVCHLIDDLETFALGENIPRNTTACTNWHFERCDYQDVCRQQSTAAEQATLKNGFIQLPIWNTEEVKPTI